MAADIMLNMLPNTLLNNTIQIVKQQKNKRKNKARTFTMMLAVSRPTSSLPRPTGLNLKGRY